MKKLMTVVLAMLFAASTSAVFAAEGKDAKKTDGKAKAAATKTDGKAKAAEVKKDEPKKDGKKK